jgi:membrane protein implicated in regulation of membrane protease activity
VKGKTFVLIAVIVAAINILVPYLALARIGSFWASFFFWCVITAAVIVFAAVYTRKWRNE